MAARVITIAQQKGGAGKTTLAAQLAVAWIEAGARVAVIDIDPQASLKTWVECRRARRGDNLGFVFAATPGWRAQQWIEAQAREADLVIVDGPPHAETEARIAVRAAALVVLPVQPSPLDLWATAATARMVADEHRPLIAVLNRVPPRSALVERIAEGLEKEGVRLAQTRIGNRIALARAMEAGLGVVESEGGSTAAAEIRALAEELREASGV
jgi:chromosome partitioning protein